MPNLKRKFSGGYNRVLNKGHYNARAMLPERMVFFDNPNVTQSLINLGAQSKQILNQQALNQQILNQQMNYQRQPKMMKYQKGPPYRGSQNANRFRGKRAVPKKGIDWQIKQTPYLCIFCNMSTKNRQGHLEHMKMKKHIANVLDRRTYLKEKLRKLELKLKGAEKNAEKKNDRSALKFCQVCCIYYSGPQDLHNNKSLHQEYLFLTDIQCGDCRIVFNDRFRYEKHQLDLDHIRNHNFQLLKKDNHHVAKELLVIKDDHDPKVMTGHEFIGDVKGHYCQICEELFLHQDTPLLEHCQSEKHYKKFKEYAKKKLKELGQEEQKIAGQEEASSIKVTTAAEPQDDEHMEDGCSEVDEDAENVEDEQAEDVEGKETGIMEDDEAENVEDEAMNVDSEAESVNEEAGDVEGEAEIAEDENADNLEIEEVEHTLDEEAENTE